MDPIAVLKRGPAPVVHNEYAADRQSVPHRNKIERQHRIGPQVRGHMHSGVQYEVSTAVAGMAPQNREMMQVYVLEVVLAALRLSSPTWQTRQ